MSRGGYRAGAGRKKGQKDTKPRKGSPAHDEAEKFRQLLSMGVKAKAKFYQEYLIRVSKGEKLSVTEKKMMDKLAADLAGSLENNDTPKDEGALNLSPLEYMLRVMNDTSESKDRRDRMAVAAAPFCHARKGDGVGKKDEKEERAKKAAAGKFSAGRPPISLVK